MHESHVKVQIEQIYTAQDKKDNNLMNIFILLSQPLYSLATLENINGTVK